MGARPRRPPSRTAPAILHKVVKDWLAMLQTLYPKLFDGDEPLLRKPTAEQVEAVKTKGYDQVLELYEVMGGESASSSEPPKSGKETEKGEGSEPDDEAGEDVEPEREDTLLRETEPFVVRLATKHATAGTLFELDDLQIDRLVISDERPPTRFNNRQMSHTIPWSLERLAWAKAFTGTMEQVVEDFIKRVEEDAKWSSEPHTPKSVTEARAKLLTALKTDVGKRSLPEWTTWLNGAIERYVGAYQASPFAAYATEGTASGESTARSRGEAGNVRQMLIWEALLEELETPKTEAAETKDEEGLETVESEETDMKIDKVVRHRRHAHGARRQARPRGRRAAHRRPRARSESRDRQPRHAANPLDRRAQRRVPARRQDVQGRHRPSLRRREGPVRARRQTQRPRSRGGRQDPHQALRRRWRRSRRRSPRQPPRRQNAGAQPSGNRPSAASSGATAAPARRRIPRARRPRGS